jgi:hypothetical protein
MNAGSDSSHRYGSGDHSIGGNETMATRKKKGKKARPMFDDGPGPHAKRAKKKATKKK